ncbi:hypothetical protein [Acidimangrovimonas pyrenivorans]|uniref:PD-(D/E)XK nuclease superfamily protein n=1 Tax=Acidimangrovimonas pyrenivorans TaxID=2030798 RepID=A0ABV7AJA8_9RHOB
MLKAVAQGKSGSLLKRWAEGDHAVKSRPQEDLVTSAVFGNLDLLAEPDRREALRLLLGEEAWKAFAPPKGATIRIELWRQGLTAPEDGTKVEPDLLLKAGERTAIVEVKWYSALSEDQLGRQLRAVQGAGREVCAILLLGLPGDLRIEGVKASARTWRDVARALGDPLAQPNTPLGHWKSMVGAFLAATERGAVFHGFGGLELTPVTGVEYRFRCGSCPPWFERNLLEVTEVSYVWKGRKK